MADSLSPGSRAFLERAKLKVAFSCTFAGAAMLCLGFCCQYGGIAQSSNESKEVSPIGDDTIANETAAGFGKFYYSILLFILRFKIGFGCFAMLVGCILLLVASFQLSPVIFGSPIEKSTLRNPQEFEGNRSTNSDMPARE